MKAFLAFTVASFIVAVFQQSACPEPDKAVQKSTSPIARLTGLSPAALDPTLGNILVKTSEKPDLLNPDYLKYFLGAPGKTDAHEVGAHSAVYYWYDKLRHPKVELHSERDVPAGRQAAVMVMHLNSRQFDPTKVESLLGAPVKRFFDSNGNPAMMYSFAPHTSITFVSPQNSFAVRKAVITYAGPLLPPPSEEDLEDARNHFIANISRLSAKGSWQEVVQLLKQRVIDEPANPEAHAALAAGLSRSGNIHEAIDEYKKTLSLCTSDDALRARCLSELKQLQVHLPQACDSDNQSRLAGFQSQAPF